MPGFLRKSQLHLALLHQKIYKIVLEKINSKNQIKFFLNNFIAKMIYYYMQYLYFILSLINAPKIVSSDPKVAGVTGVKELNPFMPGDLLDK